jgi:hypothetical protein
MTLQMLSVSFEDTSLGMSGTRTEDGQVLSVLFDRLTAESQADDSDAAPQVSRAEGVVRCEGTGWVSVQVRGATGVAGDHGYAYALGWANGRRLRAASDAFGEPFAAAVTAPVGSDGLLRLSLLLLAQRDLAEAGSGAKCWVDSIDIAVTPDPAARRER